MTDYFALCTYDFLSLENPPAKVQPPTIQKCMSIQHGHPHTGQYPQLLWRSAYHAFLQPSTLVEGLLVYSVKLQPASEKECFDLTIVLTSWQTKLFGTSPEKLTSATYLIHHQKTSTVSCQITLISLTDTHLHW